VIDITRGLKIWSDDQTYRDYLRRFAESYSSAVDTINASLAVNDRPAAAAFAHKLAGVAANLALPDTQRLALETERILSTAYDATLALARLQDALAQEALRLHGSRRTPLHKSSYPRRHWLSIRRLNLWPN